MGAEAFACGQFVRLVCSTRLNPRISGLAVARSTNDANALPSVDSGRHDEMAPPWS